jgi:hypothetical protein
MYRIALLASVAVALFAAPSALAQQQTGPNAEWKEGTYTVECYGTRVILNARNPGTSGTRVTWKVAPDHTYDLWVHTDSRTDGWFAQAQYNNAHTWVVGDTIRWSGQAPPGAAPWLKGLQMVAVMDTGTNELTEVIIRENGRILITIKGYCRPVD